MSNLERIRLHEGEISIERQRNLLASFNSSPKSLVYLLIPPEGISERDLNRSFQQISKGSLMSDITENIAWRYGNQSLCPNGLVTIQNGYDSQGKFDYFIHRNREAEQIAEAAAVLSLHFEMEQKSSLRENLGKSSSPSKTGIKAPVVRAEILQWLALHPGGGRRIDLEQELGVPSGTLAQNLLTLGDQGLIEYNSIHTFSGKSYTYQLNSPVSIPESNGRERPLYDQVSQLIRDFSLNGKVISQKSLTSTLIDEGITGWNTQRALENYVGRILKELTQSGSLERLTFRTGEKTSAKIANKGQLLVDNFLNPVTRICEGDTEVLEWVHSEIKPVVLNNLSEYARNSLDLYYPFSTSFRVTQRDSDYAKIMGFIRSNKNGFPISEIAKRLNLSQATIRSHLVTLGNMQPMLIHKKGNVNYYSAESSLAESLEGKKLSIGTQKILRQIDKHMNISLTDKIAFLCYAIWTGNASIAATAERLSITEEEVINYLNRVTKQEGLPEKYGTIFELDS